MYSETAARWSFDIRPLRFGELWESTCLGKEVCIALRICSRFIMTLLYATQRLRIIPSFKSAALTRIESLTVNPQALRLAQTSLHFQTVHLACCLGEYVHSGQMRNTGPLPLGTTSGTSRGRLSRNRQAPVGVEPRPPASAHSVSRVSSRACLALAPYIYSIILFVDIALCNLTWRPVVAIC